MWRRRNTSMGRARVQVPVASAPVHAVRPLAHDRHESEELFKLSFQHAPFPMALLSLDGHYEQVNPAMCALTGYPEAELLDLGTADVTHPDDLPADLAAVTSLVVGERDNVVQEKRYVTPAGGVIWAAESATLVRRPDGTPRCIISQLNDISAAKEVERVGREEHRRLQRAESIGRVGSWEFDVATEVVTWSPGLSRLMGRAPAASGSALVASMANVHNDDIEAARAALQVCVRTGEPQRIRYRINRMSDGVERWMDTRAEAVYTDGRVVRIVGVAADVTEEVEAEQASASAHSFEQAVMTASPDIIFVWDLPSQSAVWTNRRLTDELGYTAGGAQDVHVDPAERPVSAGLKASYDATVHATLAALSDNAAQVDLPLLHADGSRRWYSRRIAPLHRDENGAVTQIVGVLRDTTAEMAAQDALRESEAKLRQLADNIDVAFTLRTWEPDAFLYVSSGYERIFGYDPTRVSEAPTQSLQHIHHEDRDRFMAEYWAVCRAGRPVQAEYRIVRPDDGEIRWLRATNTPVPAGDGEARRSAAIITDITDSRLAEAALAAAQKAESASAATNEFLGRMSHELRTPMNAILGFAQLLELDAKPGPDFDAVQHILRAGRHLVSLIDDVLDIASIEGDQLEVRAEPLSLAELLLETTALMSPMAAAAQVELVYHPGPDSERRVCADGRRLRQVMMNLLTNAIKYNHPNGRVDVSCALATDDPDPNRPDHDSPGMLDVVVTDTGLGIRAEDLPRLFTPFDRLGVQERGIDGTGVGLALSLRLMSMMGGGLRATSEFGVGSRFIASLVLAAPAHQPAATPASAGPPPAQSATERTTRSLLYIEDVDANVALLESVVERRPHWRIVVAGHGRLGHELAATGQPDLVLLDVDLLDQTGEDVLRDLRADPVTRALAVVILSRDANPHHIDRLMAAGADGHLTKPVAVGDLLQLLERYDANDAAFHSAVR